MTHIDRLTRQPTLWVAAVLLALSSASPSFAQAEPPAIPLTLSPSGANTLTASFERTVNGLFVDTFTFTPGAFTGEVFVSLRPSQGPTQLFSAILNGEGFSFDPDLEGPTFDFHAVANGGSMPSLTVLGFAGDSDTLADAAGMYAGTITVRTTVVPEPETLGLALAGLVVAGWAAARRPLRHPPPL